MVKQSETRGWNNRQLIAVCLIAVCSLIVFGLAYRLTAGSLHLATSEPVKLPVPLSAIPEEIGNWQGTDVAIPDNVKRVAGNDDYLNRLYSNEIANQWANVYVAYTASPRTMLGHRPQVCYPAGGWIHDGTVKSQVTTILGTSIPCLIHRFHTPAPQYRENVVLNFYIVNGLLTNDEGVFSGVGWRTPNIEGDPARYAAQVQISSVLENSVRKAAEELTEPILRYLPDPNGNVAVAEIRGQKSEVRSQKSEIRSQKSEVRTQKSEIRR